MAILKTLNLIQTKELFEREAVLFSSRNGIPANRATELFGEEAVRYALKNGDAGRGFSAWGIGDYLLDYLTISGFQLAATYANVAAIRQRENGNAKKN